MIFDSAAAVLRQFSHKMLPALSTERARLDVIDQWHVGNNEKIKIPNGSTAEHRALMDMAQTPWLGLVVTNVAQTLRVDGYHTPSPTDDEYVSTPWLLWNQNGLPSRQSAIHRAALAHGMSYGLALPGVFNQKPTAVLRGVSARRMMAFYADPAEDDWPEAAIIMDSSTRYRVIDERYVWQIAITPEGMAVAGQFLHNVGRCPVVRYCNMLDLDGRSFGEVEQFIDLARRIDKTTYDRLLVQHFNSWKVRTIAGMIQPDSAAAAAAEKTRLAHEDILVSESVDTKFGSLPETPLDGFIRAHEADIKTLASVTQTPVNVLVGDLINLSADAITASRASLEAKVAERQRSFGQSHAQLLRLGAHIVGDMDAADDVMASMAWADTSIRSISTAADALGKIATMLGVPPQALWSRIPGITDDDVAEWKQMLPDTPVEPAVDSAA